MPIKNNLRALVDEYTSALRAYLAGAGEVALEHAYELGRKALAEEVGVLEMAAVHHEALASLISRSSKRTASLAANFFAESLSPFEMTHRGFREANVALRRLNEKLEIEAKRIAHALHDEAGQLLASVHLAVEDVASDLRPAERKRLRKVRAMLDEIEVQMRRLSHELRPTILDDLGLVPALEFLAEGVSARAGIPVVVEGPQDGRLPEVIETALYRIVQEALTNVAKHAQAKRVSVRLRREPHLLRCSIKDDGVGFDVKAVSARKGTTSLGLTGIRERLDIVGGSLSIHSKRGRGTELVLTVPLES